MLSLLTQETILKAWLVAWTIDEITLVMVVFDR